MALNASQPAQAQAGTEELHAALPAMVRDGLSLLNANGLHFAPIRHHSPACALALQAMIAELRPVAVLIEGPDDFDALLPVLLDERTRPPVAILSQNLRETPDDEEEQAAPALQSAFFPFCDYSPEWVALQAGRQAGAQLAFIDLPWRARGTDEGKAEGDVEAARSLMTERYLAHSAWLRTLAARSGCRDQDELWDHLFELRPAARLRNWRGLFADIFSYCAMARADYEEAVLEAEGSLPRERHMAAHIRQWRAKTKGPIVIVTGGFHTSALQAMLATAASEAKPRRRAATSAKTNQGGNWLIRYSFDRLDALNGYASGMPAPAYYQRVWNSAIAAGDGPDLQQVAADALARLARESRELNLAQTISTADVQAALLQACRLAILRGHAGPGRQDLLDAVLSCFVKGAIDEGNLGLAGDIRRVLGGSLLGDVPPGAAAPPLLDDALRLARRMGVRLDDSQPRSMRLDIYRKERHRERSRFMHLLRYLDVGLARWQSGPDFLNGTRMELLIEEWDVAWTPVVEARLIELAPQGSSLAGIALARLRGEEANLAAEGKTRSASQAVVLLTRACLIGLHQRLPVLLDTLAAHLDEDASPHSVIVCGHRLLALWRAREPLGMQEHPQLRALLLRVWPTALYLLPRLAEVKPEEEAAAIASLLSLRAFHHALRALLDNPLPGETADWPARLQAMAGRADAAPGVGSACAALLFLDGHWSEAELSAMLASHFGPGASACDAVRALNGLLSAAPELLLTQARLREDVNAILAGWDDATFIRYLPDLRQSFAQLKPQETAQLAATLADANTPGLPLAVDWHGASEQDMLAGAVLQAALAESLARDGLSAWGGTS
ncbi:DUF5682 family protein [Massilia sp. YIM B04103]|uniref:DUF5682 family protein n=1 Tax=Massilia sp. YIM B04103 TaxID=2963106 RepID=UPI00210BF627